MKIKSSAVWRHLFLQWALGGIILANVLAVMNVDYDLNIVAAFLVLSEPIWGLFHWLPREILSGLVADMPRSLLEVISYLVAALGAILLDYLRLRRRETKE